MNNKLITPTDNRGRQRLYQVEILENYYFKKAIVKIIKKDIPENTFEYGGSIINGGGRNDGILVETIGADGGKHYKLYPENFIKSMPPNSIQ